jgi:tetratricopeptide (TPR) repeat protein
MYFVRFVVSRLGVSLRRLFQFRYRGDAYQAAEEFEVAVEEYKNRVQLLNQYTSDYVSVFNEGNWYRALMFIEELDGAYAQLCELLQQGEYLDALSLVDFLLANGAVLPDEIIERVDEKWMPLEFWQNDFDEILRRVSTRLEIAAEETAKLGIERGRSRKPTLLALQELRKRLDHDNPQ